VHNPLRRTRVLQTCGQAVGQSSRLSISRKAAIRLPKTAGRRQNGRPLSRRGRGLGDALLGPMAALSRRLTAPGVDKICRAA
jgi:hypothetical protein